MQRIKNQSNKLMTDSRSKEFNLHFRMANDPEIQAAHRRISPIKTDSKANIIKYRRGGWTRTPPKYIKGENGLVKVVKHSKNEQNVDHTKGNKISDSIDSIEEDGKSDSIDSIAENSKGDSIDSIASKDKYDDDDNDNNGNDENNQSFSDKYSDNESDKEVDSYSDFIEVGDEYDDDFENESIDSISERYHESTSLKLSDSSTQKDALLNTSIESLESFHSSHVYESNEEGNFDSYNDSDDDVSEEMISEYTSSPLPIQHSSGWTRNGKMVLKTHIVTNMDHTPHLPENDITVYSAREPMFMPDTKRTPIRREPEILNKDLSQNEVLKVKAIRSQPTSSPHRVSSNQHSLNSPTRTIPSLQSTSSPHRVSSNQHSLNSPTRTIPSLQSTSSSPHRVSSNQHSLNSPTRTIPSSHVTSSPHRVASGAGVDLWFQPTPQEAIVASDFNSLDNVGTQNDGNNDGAIRRRRRRPRWEIPATTKDQDIELLQSFGNIEKLNRISRQGPLVFDDDTLSRQCSQNMNTSNNSSFNDLNPKEEKVSSSESISSLLETREDQNRPNTLINLSTNHHENYMKVPKDLSIEINTDPSIKKMSTAFSSEFINNNNNNNNENNNNSPPHLSSLDQLLDDIVWEDELTELEPSITSTSSIPLLLNASIEKNTTKREKLLRVNIESNHGDDKLVGLAGIEIFDINGRLLIPYKVSAEPKSKYSDPMLERLFDNYPYTCDELHQWLTPLAALNTLNIHLDDTVPVGCLRFWNYNKSRTHSTRGVKGVSIYLDDKCLFRGELKRSEGNLELINFKHPAESIYFVDGENKTKLIKMLAAYDREELDITYPDISKELAKSITQLSLERRPNTGNKTHYKGNESSCSTRSPPIDQKAPVHSNKKEVFKDTDNTLKHDSIKKSNKNNRSSLKKESKVSILQDYELQSNPIARMIRIVIHNTWGDPFYVGLDRIEVIGSDNGHMELQNSTFSAAPLLKCLEGMENDPRQPQNLGNNTKNNVGWLAPLATSLSSQEENVTLPNSGENEVYITFDSPQDISAIKISNYSKTPSRGAREISLYMDGLLVICTTLVKSSILSHQTIIFSNDLIKTESKYVRYCGSQEQDVLYINEKMVNVKSMKQKKEITQTPMTNTGSRPKTQQMNN